LSILIAAPSYAAVWLLFMASRGRRSFRSILFLGLTSLPLVLAGSVAFPANLALMAIVTAVWAAGLWDLNHFLAPMEPSEMRFDQDLQRIRRRVVEAEQRLRIETWDRDRNSHHEVLLAAIAEMSALMPPTPDWGGLQSQMLRALSFDAEVYGGGRRADTATGGASYARWEQVARERRRVWSARSHFMR